MILASRSKLFLEGIRKILENEIDVKIVTESLAHEEVKKHLTTIKPEFMLLDNTTLELNIDELSDLVNEKSPDTKIIIFGNHVEGEVNSISYITEETNISELISTKGLSKNIQIKQIPNVTKYNLTKTEAKVVGLVESGLKNKEIAKKLSISEKTVKTHMTHIFMKLGLQNRYQLIVYTKQLRSKVK
jgi:DNA-binding NarL/FixJ family response regulator